MSQLISLNPRGVAIAAALSFIQSLRLLRTVVLAVMLASVPQLVHAQAQAVTEPAAVTVNINTADAATLALGLNGVGINRAEDIVRYREQFGPFTTVEQLAEVKGIGPSTIEKNRKVITLE